MKTDERYASDDDLDIIRSDQIATLFAWAHGLDDAARHELEGYIEEAIARQFVHTVDDDAVVARRRSQQSFYDQVFSLCESPIERLFLCALELEFHLKASQTPCPALIGPSPDYDFVVQPQYELSTFRVDVAVRRLIGQNDPRAVPVLVVELDGHEFHERTKEQAQRDKSRDRQLQALGWKVLRFTGTEVYRDPRACALEVVRVLESSKAKESA